MNVSIFSSRRVLLAAALLLAGCDTPTEGEEHFDVRAVEVESIDGTQLARYQNGVWTFPEGDALHLHPGDEEDTRIFFVLTDGEREELPESGDDHTLRVTVGDPGVLRYESHGDHGALVAVAGGETRVVIEAWHGGHPDFTTNPGMPVEVVDHADH